MLTHHLSQVGGSSGFCAMGIARQVPNTRLIVQDINLEALMMGRTFVAQDPELKGRVEYMEHSFFTPQTVTADVYFFRHALHDWSDEDSMKILRQLILAMKDGSRVVVIEGVKPDVSDGRTVLLEDMQVL